MNVIYREKINRLINWSNRKEFNPLLVLGARHVGKTFLVKDIFAKKYYPNKCIYINLVEDLVIKEKLDGMKNAKLIVDLLEQYYKVKITNEWLIIFDELQEIPSLRTSLKSFNEDYKNYYRIIAITNYLKNAVLFDREGFPVGQVEMIDINPISFVEYLYSTTDIESIDCLKEIIKGDLKIKIDTKLNKMFIDKFKKFLLVGRLPELVSLSLSKDYTYSKLEQERKSIYDSYIADLSKWIDNDKLVVNKAINIYSSVHKWFVEPDNTFKINSFKKDEKSFPFFDLLTLFLMTNLVTKVSRLSRPRKKMLIVGDFDYGRKFKLYFNDHGFINLFYKTHTKDFWKTNEALSNVRNSLLENFVVSELENKIEVDKWTRYFNFKVNDIDYKIDLLVEDQEYDLIPIVIKSSTKFSIDNLQNYIDIYKPKYAIVLSFKNFKVVKYNNIKIFYIPIYCIGFINFEYSRISLINDESESNK